MHLHISNRDSLELSNIIHGQPGYVYIGFVFPYALLRIRCKISSVPPCCSPGTHPLCLLPRRVSGEQRGGAAEILCWIRSRAWENEPNLHILGWDYDLSLPISV